MAALLGLIVLLYGTKQRNTFELAKVPGTDIYRSLAHYPEGETCPGLLILRFDGSLFFANAHDFVTAVREAIAASDPSPQVILFDCESMNQIDATAIITIKEFHNQLAQSNTQVRLARVKTNVLDVMQRGGLLEAIPPEHFYPTVQTAVDAYLVEQKTAQKNIPADFDQNI